MRKFEIKEEDVIDIDNYIKERSNTKRDFSFETEQKNSCWTSCNFLFRMLSDNDLPNSRNAFH